MPATGFFSKTLIHVETRLGILFLGISCFRSFVHTFSFDPGSGPDREESRKTENVEWEVVGYVEGKAKPVAGATFQYKGALVDASATLAAEVAAIILEKCKGGQRGPPAVGILTPATLGMLFVDRLKEAEFRLNV